MQTSAKKRPEGSRLDISQIIFPLDMLLSKKGAAAVLEFRGVMPLTKRELKTLFDSDPVAFRERFDENKHDVYWLARKKRKKHSNKPKIAPYELSYENGRLRVVRLHEKKAVGLPLAKKLMPEEVGLLRKDKKSKKQSTWIAPEYDPLFTYPAEYLRHQRQVKNRRE